MSFNNELYSHIVLIPIVSAYLIYLKRGVIFINCEYSYFTGVSLIILGIILYLIGMSQDGRLNRNDYLAIVTFSSIIIWIGGFILFYGKTVMKTATFPLLFLFFMAPIPSFIIENVISLLQRGSAEVSYYIFKMIDIPILRDGFTFHLPGLSIEVAKQCSGIRSSIALLIMGLLLGHIFLRKVSRKTILLLLIFPIAVFKNSLRIVTLSLLGAYVDKRILSSALHKQGGIPFFILSMLLLLSVLWFLRYSERSKTRVPQASYTRK